MMLQSVVELLVCWQVVFAINRVVICGWQPIAQSGAYVGRETISVLRTQRELCLISN